MLDWLSAFIPLGVFAAWLSVSAAGFHGVPQEQI